MKILFVCNTNADNSQIAEAFFNNLSKKHKASSAGIKPRNQGFPLALLREANLIKDTLKEDGIDIGNQMVKSLNSEMIKESDLIVVMTEPSSWPKELGLYSKVVRWQVDQFKDRLDIKKIKDLVENFVKEVG